MRATMYSCEALGEAACSVAVDRAARERSARESGDWKGERETESRIATRPQPGHAGAKGGS